MALLLSHGIQTPFYPTPKQMEPALAMAEQIEKLEGTAFALLVSDWLVLGNVSVASRDPSCGLSWKSSQGICLLQN